jgi:NAD-dependent deacetylase
MKNKISLIAQKIAAGGVNIFFTGAGISTESGIPDFRSKGGIWDKFRPVYYDEFMTSEKARIEYWRQKTELYNDLIRAVPNNAHMAIAKLFGLGLLEVVITQNIDGLHQESGLPNDKIIELHGNNRRVRCMHCNQISSIHDAHKRITAGESAPRCACGGYLKPDTISFGQAMPAQEVEAATKKSQNCDVFVVVGSTLLVQPAAYMPTYAKQNGAFLAIVNLSETPCDDMCDILIRDKAGKVLQEIIEEVKQIRGRRMPFE